MPVLRHRSGDDQCRQGGNRQTDLVKKDDRKYQQQSMDFDQVCQFLHAVLQDHASRLDAFFRNTA